MLKRSRGKEIAPPPDKPLYIDGAYRAIRGASMSQFLSVEEWVGSSRRWEYGEGHLSIQYAIEIDVDEQSGSDGAPAPEIRIRLTDFPIRPLSLLAGERLDVPGGVEGWYGNDAPTLDPLQVRVISVRPPDTVGLRIDGLYRWKASARHSERFVFAGDVAVSPLSTRVHDAADAGRFLRQAFGDLWREAVTEHDDGEFVMEGAKQPERRLAFKRSYHPALPTLA